MDRCDNCIHNKICIDGANYKAAESCKHFISAADVQEVVRCKDCKYRRSSEFCECREPNFYCADGERMDGESNA